mgnify:CR=1 FL=1
MLVVFTIVLATLVLFATEPVPVDITAIGVMVSLMLVGPVSGLVLPAPLVDIAPELGVSGFSNPATLTVLAMFVLSDGVQRTGIIQVLGHHIGELTGEDEFRQLFATVGLVGPISGFINNTAAVAILLPMVNDLAHRGRTSPSKLLMPLSYASMFGGMLTVIGTSTNILASDLAERFLGEPFSMFEFTLLGVAVSIVGGIYLLTVGRWLIPERIPPQADLTEEFQLSDYLTEVVVRDDSPLVGQTVREGLSETPFDVDILQLIRGEQRLLEPLGPREIRAGDVFAVRTDRDTLVELLDIEGLDTLADIAVDEAELEAASERQNLVEVIVGPGSSLVGESLESATFRDRYDATVLAIRRGGALIRQRMDRLPLRVADTLLIQGPPEAIERIGRSRDFVAVQEIERPDVRRSKVPVAVAIVAGVVVAAAVGWLSIMVAALTGALLMVITGCLRPTEIYDAVRWDVIFLLAGVIPLGIALEQTGGAAFIAAGILTASAAMPAVVVLGLFYVVTALLTNVISNNAAVILMIPVAFDAAVQIDANPFSFILVVTFAASTAFMTPVGYQTNLFVYGPGGYRFTDFIRVGGPLQALFAVVTTIGIAVIWGV